jgi:Family of unknown function (DUF5706)
MQTTQAETGRLDAALADVANETPRTDNKASFLMALNGGLFAGIFAAEGSIALPQWGVGAGSAAALLLGISIVVQLLVILPRLSNADGASFVHWARLDEDELRIAVEADSRVSRLRTKSNITLRKMILLRWAIYLDLAAMALLLVAGISLL